MTRRLGTALVLLALVGALARTTAGTDATFTAQRSNPANTLQAASSFGGLRLATGSYTGNGSDNRAIAGLGFSPDAVIVKSSGAAVSMLRTAAMPSDRAKPMSGATALVANAIQTLDGNGFTVGTDARVNSSGVAYQWVAIRSAAGGLTLGSYSGNGSSARTVSGLGFSPEYVAVFSAGAHVAVQRYSGMARAFRFDADTGTTNRITSLDSDGFTVGADTSVNANGTSYYYVAANDAQAGVRVGSYTGNGADNRALSGVGFQPQYVAVRAGDTATSRAGVQRPASLAGDSSQLYTATANASNRIQLLAADGFQLGTDGSVNAPGVTYHYLALRDAG